MKGRAEKLKNAICREQLCNSPPRRILIRCREFIGDLVNSSGAILTIRAAFPNSFIVVEVGEPATGVMPLLMGYDELWTRPRNQGALGKAKSIRRIRRNNIDAVFMLDESRPLMVEATLARVPLKIGLHKGYGTRFYSAGIQHSKDVHETRDNFANMLRGVGLGDFLKLPEINVAPFLGDARERLDAAGFNPVLPLLSIHCGTNHPRRSWPLESIGETARIVREFGIQTAFLGSAEDRAVIEQQCPQLLAGGLDLVGRTSVPETAAILSFSDIVVVPDSALMHLAATQHVPIVALYQESIDPRYTGPIGNSHKILVGPHLADIAPEQVVYEITNLLCPLSPQAGDRSTIESRPSNRSKVQSDSQHE